MLSNLTLPGQMPLRINLPVVPSVFLYLSIAIMHLWTACGSALGHIGIEILALLGRHFLVEVLDSVRLCFAVVCCSLSRVEKPHKPHN